MDYLSYYSRREIQKKIYQAAKVREVAVKFGEKGFGRRPDILQYDSDVLEFAKQGASSFHISEERWYNPMELRPGMGKKDIDELRSGFDFIADVDCSFLEYSKICTLLLVDALKFHDVKNINVKFSGNRSFHISVPFESFPEEVNGVKTKLLFPEGPRVMAEYLKEMIKKPLSESILSISKLDEITKSANKDMSELVKNEEFDPYSIIDIDTILISSRHMLRSPYSFNEKSGLISLPIKVSEIKNFKLSRAKPENVDAEKDFFEFKDSGDATNFITQAFDWKKKIEKKEIKVRDYELPKIAIKEDFFPLCIKNMLNGVKKDGRKRAVFVLITFLRQMGWKIEEIEKRLEEWNKKNYEPLREGYIKSQLNWHKRREAIMPPNCDNKNYYADIGVCYSDSLCKKVKNPVQYVFKRIRIMKKR